MIVSFTIRFPVQSTDNDAAITHYLPMSLATQKLEERWKHHKKTHSEAEEQERDLEDVDLFSRDRTYSKSTTHLDR